MARRPEKSDWQRGFDAGFAAGRLSDPDETTIGKYHKNPRDTEFDAAYDVLPRTGIQRRAVLDAFVKAGTKGLTDYELPDLVDGVIHFQSAQPRRNELCKGGWLQDSGLRRETGHGALATVWVLTEAGRSRLNYLDGS